ncbi:hypothetical protein WN943_004691 [Citrus x changshan-huyou]
MQPLLLLVPTPYLAPRLDLLMFRNICVTSHVPTSFEPPSSSWEVIDLLVGPTGAVVQGLILGIVRVMILVVEAATGSRKTTPFCFPIINGIMREQYIQRPRGARTVYPLAMLRELERWVDILMATLRRLVNLLERGRVSLQMIIRYLALKEAADQTLDMALNQKK